VSPLRIPRAAQFVLLLLLLLWPALENGYPLVFSDSGTYISQIIERHLGWDRPPFYSLFLFLFDWGLSPWSAIAVQASIVGFVLALFLRSQCSDLVPGWVFCAVLGFGTALPFVTSEIMPDVFAPLSVMILFLIIEENAVGRCEFVALVAIETAILSFHVTILPIMGAGFLACLLAAPRLAARRLGVVCGMVLSASAALMAVNLLAYRKPELAPFSPTFYLARLIEDGPARDVLARECPHRSWALCRSLPALPRTADDFLWRPGSPLYRDGGPRRLIGDTSAIILATIAAEPGAVLRDGLSDAARQFVSFRTGDGLDAWPDTAGATISRDFAPASAASYLRSRQAHGMLAPPVWLVMLHELVGTAALLVASAGVVLRGIPAARLCLMAIAASAANACLTGIFSGPHDRYQSRMIWLVVAAALTAIGPLQHRLRTRVSAAGADQPPPAARHRGTRMAGLSAGASRSHGLACTACQNTTRLPPVGRM
jgi:hypothetical protein